MGMLGYTLHQIWKYSVRENISRALEQVEVIAHMPNGEFRTDLLISGDINGTLRYHVIDKDTTQIFPSGVRSTPEYAWPLDIENKDEVAKSPGHLWTLGCSNSFGRGNPIGCLKKMGKPGQQKILYPLYVLKDIYAYINTHIYTHIFLLKITAVGSVYVLRLNDPLMLDGRFSNTSPNLLRIADINFRILDADCNSDGSRALFGNLTSLKLYKQYFLASSEDGTMKLYDHRMVERGAVLSYRGDIGLNDNIQHAVDPSEKFVVSGGTDGKVGLWSIKSGELLFEERFMDSIPSQFCWGIKEDNGAKVGSIYNQHSNFGEAWIGGLHGLYLMSDIESFTEFDMGSTVNTESSKSPFVLEPKQAIERKQVCISIGEQMLSCIVKLIFASSSQAKAYKGLGVAAVKMVQTRELCGNITTSVKGKYNFKEEYINRVVSEPAIWRYSMTENIFSWTFEQADIVVNMPYGDIRTDLLISGDFHGSLSFHIHEETTQTPVSLRTLEGASFILPLPIGCIKKLGNTGQHKFLYPLCVCKDVNIFFDDLGNRITSGGSVYVLSLSDPLVLHSPNPVGINLGEIASCTSYIWTADCNFNGNGTILSVDIRQRPESNALLLPAHSILLDYGNSQLDSKKRWFKIKLYDHRMVNRGAVLSYEGNARLHTRIQHVVDPSEKFIMTGGIDKKVRLWSIKSGELLFEKLFMDSTPSQFCWGKSKAHLEHTITLTS
ncbi:hypothetical protein ACET3Z_004133 [Daucus carota]